MIIFLFGLIHGMGFAGALKEVGIPHEHFISALLFFNIGVELGQVTIILAAYFLVSRWFGAKDWYRNRILDHREDIRMRKMRHELNGCLPSAKRLHF